MTEWEEQFYTYGQQSMARSLWSEIRGYMSDADREKAGDEAYLTDIRLKCRQIFDYMDLEWDSDMDKLHLADVLDNVLDEVAQLVDGGKRHPRAKLDRKEE